ncbi:histone deacetylase family protein [Rubrobacter aplysinae]|uniref:histone deacetylase family protein n=1 Tax=Rubrobacter aplysinae TaxID=909625 RepID=UPI00064BAF7A|nr:histone deacetylase [Rubrobacter aplysinae]
MKVFYSDTFVLELPEDHRFPMRKYSMLRERVEAAGIAGPGEMMIPEPVTDAQILRAHEAGYLERVVTGTTTRKEQRRIGFPWSPEMVERSRRASGGTLGACRAALSEGYAANIAGGTHHALSYRGEGFCIFNDAPISIRALQDEGLVGRAVILDTDVHQGNGTAEILAGDGSVFTFSMHGAKNFPFRKEKSDLDVELSDGADDAEFLSSLEDGLEKAFAGSRSGEPGGAEIALFLAGADPFEGDRLGRLNVTKPALAERDRLVLEGCRERGLPVAVVMAGGYADEIHHTVDVHFQTVRRAAAMHAERKGQHKQDRQTERKRDTVHG